MSFLGSICKLCLLFLSLFVNEFAESQVEQTSPAVLCVCSWPEQERQVPGRPSRVLACLNSSPGGEKLEQEQGNAAFVPIQPRGCQQGCELVSVVTASHGTGATNASAKLVCQQLVHRWT